MPHPELDRFVAVMERLRRECPWDARQTHRSLVTYLVEEAGETIEAIEAGDDADLLEELGDLLLQVVFHATIAAERGAFGLDEVAAAVADKLIDRHPYVFARGDVPDDLTGSWERHKAEEKGRTSVLAGIPERLSALSRAAKVVSRARARGVRVDLPADDVSAEEVGRAVLALVGRAQASGVDAEQAVRDTLRGVEAEILAFEGAQWPGVAQGPRHQHPERRGGCP